MSDSTIRALKAEAELAKLKAAKAEAELAKMKKATASVEKPTIVPSIGASAIRAERAESELARLRAEMEEEEEERSRTKSVSHTSTGGASTIRAQKAEAEIARLKDEIKSSTKPIGASTIRAEKLEAELAKLKADMAGLHVFRAPGDSTIRAEKAEAELAELISKGTKKNYCLFYNSVKGCTKGKCTFLHEYSPDFIAKKLEQEKKLREVAERERDDALKFSAVRENMKKSMKKFKVDFAAQLKKANTLDLVIVMDCTGSMGAWIETAKAEIGRIIDSIKSEHVGVTARVGFVAYRDFCDGPSRLSTLPLTENIEKVKEFIARQSATGGGDGPEDIPGGLDEAMKLDWRAEAKLILLVNDAPCHGEEYHDPGMSDSNDSISGMKKYQSPCIRQQMRQLCKQGFDFAYIELQPEHTKKMATILEKEFNSEVPHDGVKRSFKRTLLSSATETYKFATILKSSASDSLSSSKSRSVSSLKRVVGVSSLHHYGPTGKADKSSLYSIKESSSHISTEISKLDWKEIDRLPVITARRNTLHVRPGEKIDWKDPDLKHTTQATTIKLSAKPFSKGAMRTASGMVDMSTNKRLVAKRYYKHTADTNEVDLIRKDIEAQAIAKYLAMDFSSSEGSVAIDFIFTCWYEILDSSGKNVTAVLSAEPYIGGDYKKYNNNNGWINEEFGEAAQAFSHFTWQRTYGNLMVVDLQGVNFILTDPQIHSLDESKYGIGNLGSDGMCSFFLGHKCNNVCKALRLIPFNKDSSASMMTMEAPDTLFKGTKPDVDMELSCDLCGDIFTLKTSAFREARAKDRQSNCGDCMLKIARKEKKACKNCSEPMEYSPFWYVMKGMEEPKTCKVCKEKAAKLLVEKRI